MRKAHFSLFEIDVAIPRNSVAIPSLFRRNSVASPRWFAMRSAVLSAPNNTIAIRERPGSSPSIAMHCNTRRTAIEGDAVCDCQVLIFEI